MPLDYMCQFLILEKQRSASRIRPSIARSTNQSFIHSFIVSLLIHLPLSHAIQSERRSSEGASLVKAVGERASVATTREDEAEQLLDGAELHATDVGDGLDTGVVELDAAEGAG